MGTRNCARRRIGSPHMTVPELYGRLAFASVAAVLAAAQGAAQETRPEAASRPEAESRPDDEADTKVAVSGIVVDEAGAPAAGVEVSQFWSFRKGKRSGYELVVTGPDGRFSGLMDVYANSVALVAYTADDRRAGWVVVGKTALRDVRITLKSSIRVRMLVTCRETGVAPEAINTYWSLLPKGGAVGLLLDRLGSKREEIRVLSCDSTDGSLEFRAPQGSYFWDVYDQDWSSRVGIKELVGTEPDVEIRGIRLPAAFVTRQRGKPAPDWTVTATRGAPADKRQPRDFRGKWLIVEFWGYW
jgi:hypothetical protein